MSHRVDCKAKPFLQQGPGFITENRSGARDVRQRMAHVRGLGRSVIYLSFDSEAFLQKADQLIEGDSRAAADVEKLSTGARRFQRQKVGLDDVFGMTAEYSE